MTVGIGVDVVDIARFEASITRTPALRDKLLTPAEAALTRHFVRHFLDVGFMTSEGSDGVRRALLGAMSAVITIGLFLPRVMIAKYVGIRGIPEVYTATVIGDTMMMFALAMLVAAFAAAFAGDSMFPDETDFRVLTPLPVSRGLAGSEMSYWRRSPCSQFEK